MCKGLIIAILIVLTFVSEVVAMNKNNFLYSANDEEKISEWSKEKYGFAKIEKIEIDGRKVLIVYGDAGFGTTRVIIHLYLYENQRWNLFLVRYTNASIVKVEINKEKGELIFRSKDNAVLLIQPINSLNLGFDRNK